MFHRYQTEAASKLIGGMDYTFALRGDGEVSTQIIAPAEQRRALVAVLSTLKPEALALPDPLLKIIPPRPPDYPRDRELFKIRTSPAFDALAPAESAARHTLQFLFNPQRTARLIQFHALDPQNPGLDEMLEAILKATWKAPHLKGYNGEIAKAVDYVVLYDLMALSADEQASSAVRAVVSLKLHDLKEWLDSPAGALKVIPDQPHIFFASHQIELFEKDPKRIELSPPVEPPDGPPIGTAGMLNCDWRPYF